MLLPVDPVLHPGDRLRIVCPEAPDLCVERSIGPDGTVDLPDVGALAAALRTPGDLARDIASRLDGGTLPMQVEVRLLGPDMNVVTIEGAVGHPLRLFAPRGIDRSRLLKAAEPTRDADLSLLDGPARIRPGTTLVVRSITVDRRIAVVGAVVTPQSLAPARSMPLSSALDAAGGLTAHGDPNAIVVVRAGESIPLALPDDAGFLLQAGDVVRVGTIANRGYVLVRGLVARPGSVEYAPGMTMTAALVAAGGPLDRARDGTLVWRTGTKTFRLSLAFLLARRIPDVALAPSDTIEVEARRP